MNLLDKLDFGWRRRIPVVLQTEAAECGLACLAMLLDHFGTTTDLATLRGRHGTVPQGMTLADLVRVATAEKLGTRAVRVGLRELPEVRLPCILHWDLGHFVVLKARRGKRWLVADPARGERWMTRRDMSPRFSGIALEVWPTDSFVPRQETQRVSLRQLVGRVHGLWPTLWRVLAVSLALELLGLLSPLFMQWIVDHVVVSGDMGLLTTLGLGFLLLQVVQQGMTALRVLMVLRVGTQLRVQWRSNVLNHLLTLPLDYFARRHLGDVMSRFGSISNILQVLTGAFVETALDGLMVLLSLGLMWAYSPALTGVALVSVALYVAVRLLWYGPLKQATAERIVRAAMESSHLLETVRGVRTIRLFSRQAERLSAWQTLMVADVNANLRIQRLDIFYKLARRTLSGVFTLAILWIGARNVVGGTLSLGMLLAFLAYRNQFDTRVSDLVNRWFELRMLGLDAERLADIVLTPPEADTGSRGTTGKPPIALRPPALQLAALQFRYAEGAANVVDGLDLVIPSGQAVAFCGPSGCGKTTLVQLLLGVYRPQQGQIRVDGVPLDQIGLDAWRARIGTVLQDDVLFAGSIADNIAFFDPTPDRGRIERSARLAAVHEDIVRFPMQYQTLVGDMGTTLSGGQKQRVLLARALYRMPTVLVLDEATSHLDLAREAQVGQAIARLPMTRIIVAHRPQTLALVDRVIELADGRILRDETALQYAARLGLPPRTLQERP
ncbi:peptidase domain-containing ABC transporter [Sphaerotilus sp.]|uniref:peptidase domain-containing ABC transporter n=1 Tax=Sphaerotilus sp. TaxID=2093942 RepID=UPI00286E14A9|nr:peptidase domain-containing ABC transporter [Sphaerotilus sp.]